jgi:hypothetical protein
MHEYLYKPQALPKVEYTEAQDSRTNPTETCSKKTNISYLRLSHQETRANIQAVKPLL